MRGKRGNVSLPAFRLYRTFVSSNQFNTDSTTQASGVNPLVSNIPVPVYFQCGRGFLLGPLDAPAQAAFLPWTYTPINL